MCLLSVLAMVLSCDFSSPIVGLTLVFDPTNFQNDLGSSLTLVAMFLPKVTLASLMRLVVLLRILLKYFKSVIIFCEIIYIPHLSFVLGGSSCLCCHPGSFGFIVDHLSY